MTMQVAALIPAHNEALVIGAALASLHAATPPPDVVLVVADHCSDLTAQVAEQNGAIVLRRDEGESGKGAALRWLFERFPPALAASSIVAVFDADSHVHPHFFAEVGRAFARGARAFQGFVQPVGHETSIVATLAAYSELLSQLVDDAIRARLGWPVPLRGTGMAFGTEELRELLPGLHTRTEDIELSLSLAGRGEHVEFLPQAIVYDAKPADLGAASRQRARWLQGQAQVWRGYGPQIIRLLGRGPGAWWLLSALLLKPKTFFVALKAAAFAVALALPLPGGLKALAGAIVLAELVYYVAGLWRVPLADRARYARALGCAPVYLWVWGRGLLTAIRSHTGWLSVRH
jgi:cellulose synthase/poly-beta-1,6-N-acetylglucosamine synthase-like glycosyltransferase